MAVAAPRDEEGGSAAGSVTEADIALKLKSHPNHHHLRYNISSSSSSSSSSFSIIILIIITRYPYYEHPDYSKVLTALEPHQASVLVEYRSR